MLEIIALAISFIIGYAGYSKKVIDFSGFMASLLIGIIVILALPVIWFVPLVALFVMAGATARYKYGLKRKKGIAERKGGRTMYNIFGNGAASVIAAGLFSITHNPVFIFAYISSIASACADTVATELGQLSRERPLLILSWKKVPAGTTGAVSVLGEFMAFFGAFVIAVIPFLYFGLTGSWDMKLFAIPLAAGFLGCQIDSVIGSTLEIKNEQGRAKGIERLFNNHTTNFLSSLAAGMLGAYFYISWI